MEIVYRTFAPAGADQLARLLGLLLVAIAWLLTPKIFSERWGEFGGGALMLASLIAIGWNKWHRRARQK